jgi:hypothetical protein
LTGILLGGDFISYYAGGWLYRANIAHLYDPATQQAIMETLIAPSQSPGFAPFISTPAVALAYSPLTYLPLEAALILWSILMLVCLGAAAHLLYQYLVPIWLSRRGLSARQLAIVIAGSFAFVDGAQAGQNHALSLLLVTGAIIAIHKERWMLAGTLVAMLTYKPQYVIGFLVVWLVWQRWQALLAFGAVALLWQAVALAEHGIAPFIEYSAFARLLLYLPFAPEGFPVSIMATPYALAATLLPSSAAPILQGVTTTIGIGLAIGLGFIAWRARHGTIRARQAVLAAALLYPLLVSPHALLHDLVLLVPAFLLLVEHPNNRRPLLFLAITAYLGTLFLPLIGQPFKVALPAIIPLAFFLIQVKIIWQAAQEKPVQTV